MVQTTKGKIKEKFNFFFRAFKVFQLDGFIDLLFIYWLGFFLTLKWFIDLIWDKGNDDTKKPRSAGEIGEIMGENMGANIADPDIEARNAKIRA